MNHQPDPIRCSTARNRAIFYFLAPTKNPALREVFDDSDATGAPTNAPVANYPHSKARSMNDELIL